MKTVTYNKYATYEYFILEKFEALRSSVGRANDS